MNAAPGTRSIVIERDFAHPPEKIWRALTQPHLVAEWLMRNDFKLSLGHKFKLHGDWGGVLDCEILKIETHKLLSYRWDYDHEDDAYRLQSVVTFTLTPTEAGTRLRVEQEGFRPTQKQALAGANAGWRQMLEKLERVVSRDL